MYPHGVHPAEDKDGLGQDNLPYPLHCRTAGMTRDNPGHLYPALMEASRAGQPALSFYYLGQLRSRPGTTRAVLIRSPWPGCPDPA